MVRKEQSTDAAHLQAVHIQTFLEIDVAAVQAIEIRAPFAVPHIKPATTDAFEVELLVFVLDADRYALSI